MRDEPRKSIAIDSNICDELFATFDNTDNLVEALRKRMINVGLSFGVLDEILGTEGAAGKYLSPLRVRRITLEALLRLTSAVGLRAQLVVDETWRPDWEKCDRSKARAGRQPRLGAAQLRRVLKPAAAELGRRGSVARMASTTHEQRCEIGRRGALKRWGSSAPTDR
jgi:hypothetical protein